MVSKLYKAFRKTNRPYSKMKVRLPVSILLWANTTSMQYKDIQSLFQIHKLSFFETPRLMREYNTFKINL